MIIKTKYGKKIVLVVAGHLREFEEFCTHLKDPVQPPTFSQGVFYTKDKNYRYISDPTQMRGFRGVEVIFIGSWRRKFDDNEMEQLAWFARQK